MRKVLALVAAMVPTAVGAAPFAIIETHENLMQLVDLGSLGAPGDRVRFRKVYLPSDVERAASGWDYAVHQMEADCRNRRVRVTAAAVAKRGKAPAAEALDAQDRRWTATSPDELSLACTGRTGRLQVLPTLDVARAILNSGSGRSTD